MRAYKLFAFAGAMAAASAWSATDQDPTQTKDLGSLGLEELMKVQVTTASKQAQSLSQVAAAIYVITAEQIRRSGATVIPELLRVVPGVQVQQISPSQWAVGIRGMGNRFSNKLLVLMDGRTVYSPSFSGVYWDAQDIDVSLIERIEVIRGPGGTLWGTNAVNGIINIITKAAAKTKGDTLSLESGTQSPYRVAVVHGGDMPNGSFRVDAQAFRQNSLDTIDGIDGNNAWDSLSGGFRTDWLVNGNSFSLNGRADSSHQGSQLLFPTLSAPYTQLTYDRYTTSEYSLIGKWEKTAGTGKGDSLQISFDHYDRDMPEAGDRRTTGTLDYQHPVPVSKTNRLMTGVGYQLSEVNNVATPYISIWPNSQTTQLYSVFVYDEQDLNKRTKVSLGTKLEHNDYTGWEIQPSARVTFSPSRQQTFWGAISRAVRTPSLSDDNTSTFLAAEPGPGGVPVKVQLVGNPNFESEVVIADELGWRFMPSDRSFIDLATFYNQYSDLRGGMAAGQTLQTSPFPYVQETVELGNDYSAVTAGAEVAAHYAVSRDWRLDGSYAYYTETYNLSDANGGFLGDEAAGAGAAPRHQFTLQSQLDLPHKIEFDATGYYVGQLEGTPSVSAYARLDLRLGWHANKTTEFSLGVTNLTNTSHLEAYDQTVFLQSSLIRRNVYARIDFHF
jgi:iron complex outermembrane receptor protein